MQSVGTEAKWPSAVASSALATRVGLAPHKLQLMCTHSDLAAAQSPEQCVQRLLVPHQLRNSGGLCLNS